MRPPTSVLPRPSAAFALVAAALLPCSAARAQWVTGLGADAVVLPRGVVRMTVSGVFDGYDERFGADAGGATSGRVPLGSELSVAALDASVLPAIAGVQAGLRTLSGVPTLGVSLGRLQVTADARRAELPVRFDVGVGARLQLSVASSYVQTRVAVGVSGDPTATEANLGVNPAMDDAAARAANGALVGQLRDAASQLEAQLASCSGSATPACARPAEAEALRAQLAGAATVIADVYGTAESGGSAYVPVAGSDAAAAIASRLATLAARSRELDVTAVPANAAPSAAAMPITPGQLLELATAGSAALGLPALRETRRYGMGDVEVGAKFRLLDPLRGDLRAVDTASGTRVRASLAALVRLGTGRADDALVPLDLGVGDGQHDVEVGIAADVLSGRRFITSVAARYGVQLADELDRAVPAAASLPYAVPGDVRAVRRDLGDYVEAEITPRYAFNEYLSVGAHYLFRAKGEDRYELAASATPNPAPADASLLGAGTELRQHVAGFGIVASTLRAYARGAVRWPVDVSYRHTTTIAGAGRLTPRLSRDEVALRLYVDVFGSR